MPGMNEDTLEMQEIHCHNCDRYVQFPIDLALNGRHVLNCPNCGHEHCRIVYNGKISEERWDRRNGDSAYAGNMMTFQVPTVYITSTITSTTANVVMWYSASTMAY